MAKIPDDEIIDLMEDMLHIAGDSTRLKILYSLACEEIGLRGNVSFSSLELSGGNS